MAMTAAKTMVTEDMATIATKDMEVMMVARDMMELMAMTAAKITVAEAMATKATKGMKGTTATMNTEVVIRGLVEKNMSTAIKETSEQPPCLSVCHWICVSS